MHGRAGGWMDRRIDGCIYRMAGCLGGCKGGFINMQRGGGMWMHTWMDRSDGRMDVWVERDLVHLRMLQVVQRFIDAPPGTEDDQDPK